MTISQPPARQPADDVLALDAALVAFHSGSAAELERFLSDVAKTSNSYRSALAERLLAERPVTEVTPDGLQPWMGQEVAGLHLTPDLAARWQRVLDGPAAEKIRLLEGLAAATAGSGAALFGDQAQAFLNGTLMVEVPFIGLTVQGSGGTGRILLMSLQSPLDALYLPDQRLIVQAAALRFSASARLKKLIAAIVREPDDWWRLWDGRATDGLVFLLRDKRPYHVLLDEFSGHFDLCEQGFDLPMVYFNRSAFVETGRLLADLDPAGRERGAFSQVIVRHHRRADKDAFGLRFHDMIAARARRHAETAAPDAGPTQTPDARPLVWIGIAGGEKRRWFEEEAALSAVIAHIRHRVGPCRFVFDGWTAPLRPGESDSDQIGQHRTLRDRIVASCGLGPDAHCDVIGTGILTKLNMARQADFFISCGGTPSVWPSLVCGLPGVVHNSRSMLPRVGNTYRPENVVRVPDSMIEDVNEVGDAIRWDRYSYHIAVEDFLTCVDEALDLLASPRARASSAAKARAPRPADFTAALIAARKTGQPGRVSLIEGQCRFRLADYRNLSHILTSTAFFGRPEVAILDETPGVCRIVDCDTRIVSDTVFVTFGKVSSNIDHIPFGYPFLTRQGFRHIHVAQLRRTSYQLLDLAGFVERIVPRIAGYRHRFTYGASLGGYAALYYGTQIGAQVIAGSPRLPLHPENKQFEGTAWHPGSHWDEAPYLHRSFADIDTTKMPPPLILFDLADVIDCNFIQRCIAPHFARLVLHHIRDSRHGALMHLQKEGQLKQTISDLIETARRRT